MQHSQNSATERSRTYEDDKKKTQLYLRLIAEMIQVDSMNKGTFRKDIWQMLLNNKTYKASIDYGDFLRAIQALV